MDSSRISEKQKRLRIWRSLLDKPELTAGVRAELSRQVEQYSKLLFDCWETGVTSEAVLQRMQSIERELQNLDETARLRA